MLPILVTLDTNIQIDSMSLAMVPPQCLLDYTITCLLWKYKSNNVFLTMNTCLTTPFGQCTHDKVYHLESACLTVSSLDDACLLSDGYLVVSISTSCLYINWERTFESVPPYDVTAASLKV